MAEPTDAPRTAPPEEDVDAQIQAWLATPVEGDESEVEDERRGAPVRSFWQKVLRGDGVNSRLKEAGRSVVRGAANFANETGNTASKAVAFVDRKTGLGEALTPGFNAAYDTGELNDMRPVKKARLDEMLGRRSDDPLAAFAEDATQFAIGFVGTGGVLGTAAKARTAVRIANAATRGAVVDAASFDPDEAQLAELAARAPEGYGIRELGEALSVNGTDSELVKRVKRGAAGVIPGVALDGLIAGAQRVWARKVSTSATATPAEKLAAETISEEAGKTLAAIADGTHVTDGAHVVVKDNGDGTFGMRAIDDAAEEVAEDAPKFSDRAEAEAQAETINAGMNERLEAARQAGGLTTDQAEQLRTAFRSLLSDPTSKALDEGTHFNFSYYSEPDEVLASIESVSRVFKEELDAAQVRDGVSIEEQAERLREMVGGLDPEQAPGLMAAMLENGTKVPQSIVFGAADLVLRDIALKSARMFDVVTARPHDVIAWEEARHAAGSLLKLQKALAGAHSEWGRTGRFMQERDTFAGKAGAKDAPAPKADAEPKPAGDPADEVAGMSKRDVLTVLKMAKASGGKPSKLGAIAGGAKIIQETGMGRRALEFFVNSALSSPVTGLTALSMNASISTFEAFSKMVTGAIRFNKPMMQEGADILYANERFIAENFSTAMMAFRQGRSVIHPTETHIAIPGKLGAVIRTPSRVLLYADEFTRVTNYRSFVFAKSRRYWRERGLDGESLESAVQNDLRDAFDPKTGAATIPDGMKYAEMPTMSADLGRDTFGGKLTNFLNNSVEAKFIAPFVKTSINIFRYNLDRTPLLNMLAKRNRDILNEGGEAAAILHTQSVMATGVATWAYMKAKSGEVTGSGPKEPGLRKMWLQDHKPYSIKIGGEWVSYRRLDPLLTPVSIMADVHAMVQELGSESEAEAEDILAASFAGVAAAFANKSYMVGMTSFFEAWSGGEGNKMKRWLNNFGSTFVSPQVVRAMNDDPYLREVDGFIQTVMSGIPGLSEKLPARYNVFGEPELRTHSLSPMPVRGSAERTVATDLYQLGRGIAPMTRKSINGVPVDLTDGAKFGRVEGLTPYEYAMKIVREPGDGEPSLKKALTEIVASDEWKDASPGSEMFPGGERFVMAYRVIDGYRKRALGEVLDRFPAVQQEVEMQRELKGASMSEGQAGALDVLREYGKQ